MNNQRPRPPADLDALIAETVAESLDWTQDTFRGWKRIGGSKRACDRSLEDLAAARDRTRRLLEGSEHDDGNEYAIGAAENRKNYVVGETGFEVEPVMAPGFAPEPGLLADVKEFLDLFAELNAVPEMQAESLYRVDCDGEAGLRLFPADGVPELRWVQPERVRPPAPDYRPPDGTRADEWGALVAADGSGRRLGYFVEPDIGTDPVLVPEAEIVWLTLSPRSDHWRGWPTFEPVIRALVRAEELLFAGSSSVKAQAKIAAVRKMKGLTKATGESIKARLTERPQAQPDGSVPVQETTEHLPYSAMLRIPADDEMEFPSPGSAEAVTAMIDRNLTAAAVRMNMPKWMFTGEASEKFSNAFVGEGPALKQFSALRRPLFAGWVEGRLRHRASVFWRAVRLGVAAGLLPVRVLTRVRLKASAPSLEVRDKLSEAQTNDTYIKNGVKNVPLVQKELGIDPAQAAELAKKAADQAEPGAAPAAGGPADPNAGGGLRGTVGGLQAISALQESFYAGKVPRAAAVATMVSLFGFAPAEAEAMFPPVDPVVRTPPGTPA